MLAGVKTLHFHISVAQLVVSTLVMGMALGCASDALSLEDPVIRTVRSTPTSSVQRLQHTLTFTVNFSMLSGSRSR